MLSLTPQFDSGTTNYTAVVASDVTSVTVTPIAEAATAAAITVNGQTVTSGVESNTIVLDTSTTTTITVAVTAQDRTTMTTYIVTVTVEADTPPSFEGQTIVDPIFEVGRVKTVTLPAASGGNTPLTYTLSPALPANLTYNANELTITGTPRVTLDSTSFTYTVTDDDGDTVELGFTIAVYNPVTLGGISDVGLTAGRQIAAFRLPAATGGSGEYDYTVEDLPDDLTFDAGTLRISGTPATAEAGTAVSVRYTASDVADDGTGTIIAPAVQTFEIAVAGDSAGNTNDFVTTWRTTSDNESITIPTTESGYDYTVDWGDPNATPTDAVTSGHTGNATHQYAAAGTYTVRISGDFPRIFFAFGGDIAKIIAVNQWGGQQWSSMNSAFAGARNLTVPAGDNPDLRNVTSMSNMFVGAAAFNENIGDWDVSNVRDMTSMLSSSGLDVRNYDALLIGWSTIEGDETGLQTGVTFGGGAEYCTGASARDILRNDYEWSVDGAVAADCTALLALSVSHGPLDPTFDPRTTAYEVKFDTNATRIRVTPTVPNPAATITVNGTTVATATAVANSTPSQQIDLNLGLNTITVAVTATSRDGTMTMATYTIEATREAGNTTDFVTTWRTTDNNQLIRIPTTEGGYDFNVDWGDDTVQRVLTGDTASDGGIQHTYELPGDYEVRISGTFPRIYTNGNDRGSATRRIRSVDQWGDQVWSSMEGAFYGASDLTILATDSPDLTNVSSMAEMFRTPLPLIRTSAVGT